MRRLSFWAAANKKTARLLVITGFLLIYLLGINAGRMLKDLDLLLPMEWLTATAVLYFSLLLLYPYKHRKAAMGSHKYYWRQKAVDFGLATVLFLLLLFVGNHPERAFRNLAVLIRTASATSLPGDSSRSYKTGPEFASAMRDANGKLLKWKERKKLLRSQVKAIRKSEMSGDGKVGLIILSVLLALGLAFGVAVLACSLACNDQGILAALVAIGGLFLIIWGLIHVIRSINKKREKPAT